MTGAAIKRIILKTIKSSRLPLPSLPEQKSIVAILDEAFTGIATAVANTEKNLANARELFESYLNSKLRRCADQYELVELQRVAEFQGGSQPPKSVFIGEPRDGYVRLLQIRDFKSDDKAVYIPVSKKIRVCLPSDVMIGRYGASVGQIHTGKGGAYNVALIKAMPDTGRLVTRYFYYYLLSDLFQKPLASVASRSAQAGFSKEDIAPFPVPLPPMSEQEFAAESLDELHEQAKRMEKICEIKLSALRELKQSLLQKAFSGGLTAAPQEAIETALA
jgi:type I restriction enzyme S subunit